MEQTINRKRLFNACSLALVVTAFTFAGGMIAYILTMLDLGWKIQMAAKKRDSVQHNIT